MESAQTKLWLEKKFDELYSKNEDPWGCFAGRWSFNNRLFTEMIFCIKKEAPRILDIGCGLGGLTDNIRSWSGGAEVWGADVSQTAVIKAAANYPLCNFIQWDILEDEVSLDKFDLVTMSEVLWYVCHNFKKLSDRIAGLLSDNGMWAIHQYFPLDQKYYREFIDGMNGFETLMESFGWAPIKRIVSYTNSDPVLLALYNRRAR